MRLTTLAACALFSAVALSAAPTFASFNYAGTPLQWGGCTTAPGCTATVTFNYDGSIVNVDPYNTPLTSTLTYTWASAGAAVSSTVPGLGTVYAEPVTGTFAFTYNDGGTTENLLTIDFSSAQATLVYYSWTNELSLVLNSTTSSGTAPVLTSSILTFASGASTDWSFVVNFGSTNPGVTGGSINSFTSQFDGIVGISPYPSGQVPEPASMFMAGMGLLALGGLGGLRKRFQK
jgi:MYXO-CTERM domain-containing protein